MQVFDWLIRSHALGQVLPLPVDEQTAMALERLPLMAFSPFGSKAICAARSWDPAPPPHLLRADGAVLVAVRAGDVARVRAACEAREPVDAPTTMNGYTPLSIAIVRKDAAMVRALLELGADPGARSDGGNFPLGHGIVHDAPLEALQSLVARGADPKAVNDDGFGTLHAAAEAGNAKDPLCSFPTPYGLATAVDVTGSGTAGGDGALSLDLTFTLRPASAGEEAFSGTLSLVFRGRERPAQ